MSQWKPKQRRSKSSSTPSARSRRVPFEVTDLGEGLQISFPEGAQGWLPLATYEKHHGPGRRVHLTACKATGETWVKVFVGRYQDRDEQDLRQRLAVLQDVAQQLGGEPFMGSGPLWLQVEFLENVLEFDLRPPCGCPPKRAVAAA